MRVRKWLGPAEMSIEAEEVLGYGVLPGSVSVEDIIVSEELVSYLAYSYVEAAARRVREELMRAGYRVDRLDRGLRAWLESVEARERGSGYVIDARGGAEIRFKDGSVLVVSLRGRLVLEAAPADVEGVEARYG